MIKNGVLMPWMAISYMHREEELRITQKAIEETFKIYRKAVDDGFEKYLVGDLIKPVFRKYN